MRCSAHDLALGPDGQCVLCRRQATLRPPSPPGRRAVNVLAVLVGLTLLGGAGWAAWLQPADAPPEPEAPRTLAAAEPAPESEPEEPRDEPERRARPRPEPEEGSSEAIAPASPGAVADAGAEPPRPPPTQAEITAALRSTPVWMFTTAWCGVCNRARAFFRANQIPFQERDIDKSPSDRRELIALTGKASIPYIDIDGQRLSGFAEQSAAEALRRSVERRLGVKGLQLQQSR